MNIFVTDECPIKSAQNLDDKRVIKMILESAQMLSVAMHVWCAPNPPYKMTHKNHPCTVWARTTQANYQWLLDHFKALLSEYTSRYGKKHKCQQYVNTFQDAIIYIPAGERTPFANCTLSYLSGL
jgi:hypothetical protein